MDVYERLIEQMRKSGQYHNPPSPMLGIMGADGKIKVNDITLDTDDYLMDCNLRINGESMFYHKEKSSSSQYATDSSHNASLEEYKNNILSEGDKVLVMKLPNEEMYILIAKVVSPV